MSRAVRSLSLVLAALAAGCDAEQPVAKVEQPAAKPAPKPTAKQPAPTAPKLEMPKFEPLTAEKARSVLHAQLASLGGDDTSRLVLLYLADLGDRSGVKAARELLLSEVAGKFEDVMSAALGAEALLVYGEPDGGAVAIRVMKQYAEDGDDADEALIHALARVQGAERAEAVARLVKIAEGDSDPEMMDEQIATVAVQALAASAAPEAREAFLRLATNAELEPALRSAAVAGLISLGDPKGAELASGLATESTREGTELDASEVIRGFGIPGATGTVPYITRILDTLVANEEQASFEVSEMAPAIVKIYSKGGGAEGDGAAGGGAQLLPWLREFDKKEGHEGDTDIPRWALGDDSAAPAVAEILEVAVAAWAGPNDTGHAVELLDVAARRGVAAKPPFRAIVDSAAQVTSPASKTHGVNLNLVNLNLAAAHAFLKSQK